MDTKYLNYLITIAEERNMTKAAEKLYVSQSSLSHYVAKLEQELNTPLFFRTRNQLLLTAAGELYVETARQMIEMKKNLYQKISYLENKGKLSIFTTSQWGLRMLTDIIPVFKAAYPEISFVLTEESVNRLSNMLANGSVDFALMSVGSKSQINQESELIQEEELFFAVPRSHPYVPEHSDIHITPQTLIDHFSQDRFLLSREGSANRYLVDQMFQQHHINPASVDEINSILTTRAMTADGVGVSFIPQSCKGTDNEIQYYHLDPPLYRYNILVHRKNLVFNPPETLFQFYVRNYIFPEHITDSNFEEHNPNFKI